ncbi:MAG TPA: hypothetical protein VF786_02995 [Terriglobales bacterium]
MSVDSRTMRQHQITSGSQFHKKARVGDIGAEDKLKIPWPSE